MKRESLRTTILIPAIVMAMSAVSGPLAFGQTPASTMPGSISHRDSSFLKDAAEGGMDEVRLGRLAQQNAASDRVKKFGERMVTDHTRMGGDVSSLAASKNVALPNDIGWTDKASNKMLSSKTGAGFDKAYISSMIKDHRSDVAAFQKEANEGSDPDVKALASKALPTLEEHLRMAEDIGRELGVQ